MSPDATPLPTEDPRHALVHSLYTAFNAGRLEAVITRVASDVAWENGLDGGHVRGHAALRAHWTRQFREARPLIEPGEIRTDEDDTILVDVHQTVKHPGTDEVLFESDVVHRFSTDATGERITGFDIVR